VQSEGHAISCKRLVPQHVGQINPVNAGQVRRPFRLPHEMHRLSDIAPIGKEPTQTGTIVVTGQTPLS